MDITRISLNGFKNIAQDELILNKVNALISTNNYGKSNLLDAIFFAFNFITQPNQAKEKLMKWSAGISLLNTRPASNFIFEMEFNILHENKINQVIYGFEFSWHLSQAYPAKIVSESLKVKTGPNEFLLYFQRKLNKATYRTSPLGACDKKVSLKNNELLINKLNNDDSLFYINIVKSINQIDLFIDRYFDSNELFNPSNIINKDIDNLYPSNEMENGLPKILHQLRLNDIHSFELILNTLMDFYPEIEEIIIKKKGLDKQAKNNEFQDNGPYAYDDHAYGLFINTDHFIKHLNFAHYSNGAKKLLTRVIKVVLSSKINMPIIAIEEPENSIHPSYIKKYLNVLEQLTSSSKLIITTHSPSIVNNLKLSDLHIGIPSSDGIASFAKINESSYQYISDDAKRMKMQIGDYLFDLINSEDETDIENSKKYLNR